MCTSIVTNFKKTIVGWNLDYEDPNVIVVPEDDKVLIEVYDKENGWMPLFGANNRGEFIAMPTCWPYDKRSDQVKSKDINIINLDIDLLLKKRTFVDTLKLIKKHRICSIPNLTFMGHHSDHNGNVLEIVPGQGAKFIKKPKFKVLTNFSPYKMNSEVHPFMGYDRYQKATKMLEEVKGEFSVDDCFEILKAVVNKECPTRVSMVFDVSENTVYWVEKQDWKEIQVKKMIKDRY